MVPRRAAIAGVLLGLALVTACGGEGASPTRPPAGRTVTVFAASSMRAAFATLATTFEASHPGVTVTVNLAGSATLAEQLLHGARADVLASANEASMDRVVAAGLASGPPRPYASNRLTIAVPPGNPAGISSLRDLSRPGLTLVICAPVVPCGAATVTVARAAGVALTPVSEEQAVTDVLAKVQAGEVDAGLVYRTDVLSAGATVIGIDFPESSLALTTSTIASLRDGPQAALGREFVDLVLSAEGQRVLAEAGFGAATH